MISDFQTPPPIQAIIFEFSDTPSRQLVELLSAKL